MSYVIFLTSYVMFLMSYVIFLMSYVIFLMSYVIFLMSYVIFLMSYVIFLMSYVIFLMSYVIGGVFGKNVAEIFRSDAMKMYCLSEYRISTFSPVMGSRSLFLLLLGFVLFLSIFCYP